MKFTTVAINTFLFFKLPSAFWCGVRLKSITEAQAVSTVKHRWFNQNPFKSMYFAVQAMAAELTTGVLVMRAIRESGHSVSMLVASNKSFYYKKATGRIQFSCEQGVEAVQAVRTTVEHGEGVTVWLKSVGHDAEGVLVSEFLFEWTVKRKQVLNR